MNGLLHSQSGIEKINPAHPIYAWPKSEMHQQWGKKAMQKLLWILQREKNRGNNKQEMYTCEKRTFDQYVEIFKENNPKVLNSILEYRYQHD